MYIPSLLLLCMASKAQDTMYEVPGVMGLFDTAQTFLGTLHDIMQEGAAQARSKGNESGAEDVEMFEYNWLSIFGYSKGILPLISDFYFNYFKQEAFMKNNGHFVRYLRQLIRLFAAGGSVEEMYDALNGLIGDSLRGNLFQEGSIRTFLEEFDAIIKNKPVCFELLNSAKLKAHEIAKFLHFILKGSPPTTENTKPRNSEL